MDGIECARFDPIFCIPSVPPGVDIASGENFVRGEPPARGLHSSTSELN